MTSHETQSTLYSMNRDRVRACWSQMYCGARDAETLDLRSREAQA